MKVLIDAEKFVDYLKKNNFTNYDITKKCGVNNTTINKILHNEEIPYLTARKIAKVMDTNTLLIIR